jgi:chromosomal replication initiator protein
MHTSWDKIKSEINKSNPDGMKAAILKSIRCLNFDNNDSTTNIELSVPSTFHQESAERLLRNEIASILNHCSEKSLNLSFAIENDQLSLPLEMENDPAPSPVALASTKIQWMTRDGVLNPKFSLDRFIWSETTEMARVGVQLLSASETTPVRQLFLYGPSGLGKTHLLHGIGNQIRSQFPHLKIRICRADEFMNHFTTACRSKLLGDFKKKYRLETDVLLIDDIHCLANGRATQDEFFNVFNYFADTGKIMAFTSDKPPREITGFEDRLITRFEGSFVARLTPPSRETLFKIAVQKSLEHGYEIPTEILEEVTTQSNGNVRTLEGFITRLGLWLTWKKSTGPISPEQIREAAGIQPTNSNGASSRSADQILESVARKHGLTLDDLHSPSRKRTLVAARREAATELRTKGLSLTEIGRLMNRDHTTIMNLLGLSGCPKLDVV